MYIVLVMKPTLLSVNIILELCHVLVVVLLLSSVQKVTQIALYKSTIIIVILSRTVVLDM